MMDLIDRAEVKKLLLDNAYDDGVIDMEVDELIDEVNEIPSARPKGKWIKGIEVPNRKPLVHLADCFYCSVCHNEAYWDTDYGQQLFDYCPYCGAEMENDNE